MGGAAITAQLYLKNTGKSHRLHEKCAFDVQKVNIYLQKGK
jgi:hypothetical protein